MAKSKRDHLDRDAAAAQKAGLSYGQYKAEHPHTTYPETTEPEEETLQERRCGVCGQRFKPSGKNKKYCSPSCQDIARRQRDRQYNAKYYAEAKKEKPPAECACAICGKIFRKTRNTSKYCSPPCREQGNKLHRRAKEARHRARKKEAMKNV